MDEKKLEGKVALVTGSSRGIGKAIANIFSKEGARVALNYFHSEKEAFRLQNELPRAKAFRADISDRSEVSEMMKEIREEMGGLDIVVNNAGRLESMNFEDFDQDGFDRMLGINTLGPIYTVLESLDDLKKSDEGIVINIASNAGIGTTAIGSTFYAMTKAATIILTKRLAFDLRGTGIRINGIAPGWVETEMTTGGMDESDKQKVRDTFSSRTTLHAYGLPENIASVALFLASKDSAYMNGQVLVVDGGRIDNLTHGI